jgi:PTH1 family peptidyl-tRNA hydrolase
VDYVLGHFGQDEQPDLLSGLDQAVEIFEGFAAGKEMPILMNQFN